MKQETLTVFKNFSSINKYIRINKGNVLTILNPSIPLFAMATVPDTFSKTFSLYDLNQWLSTLSLFDNPNIDYDDKMMTITSGRMSAKYRYSSPETTADQPNTAPTLKDSTFEFTLKKEQLSEILKASSVLGLKELEFSIKGLRTFNSDAKGNPLDNEYITEIEDVTSSDIENAKSVRIKVEALKMLPLDYAVKITERAVVFTNEENEICYVAGLIK